MSPLGASSGAVASPPRRAGEAVLHHVLFYRSFRRFTGGHLKVWHYFNHVLAAPGYEATVRFARRSRWDASNPWAAGRDRFVEHRRWPDPDLLFLAGRDWERLPARRRRDPGVPIVNLVQHVRHARPGDARHRFLERRAIRICVSDPVAEAITATGKVAGPVLTIPAGLDIAALPAPAPPDGRPLDLVVLANKQPARGAALHGRLARPGRSTRLITEQVPRAALLDLLNAARVTVLVPNPTEGFFLPSLEAMALGTVVVCPDCVGNRGHCRPGENSFLPAYDLGDIADQAERALALAPDDRAALISTARATAEAHDLANERAAFHNVLARVPELWARDTT